MTARNWGPPTFALQRVTLKPGMDPLPCEICELPFNTGLTLRRGVETYPTLICATCAAGLRDGLAMLDLPPAEPGAFTVVNPSQS